MRVLITIPHYYRPSPTGAYGSLSADAQRRRRGLGLCLAALHATFGDRQALIHPKARATRPANEAFVAGLEVVVCTTGSDHLIQQLPAGLCRHHPTSAPPPLLGYECHAILRENLGRYDYYGYIEDDLLLTDALFFQKLRWFDSIAADPLVLLQPNRFEQALGQPLHKLYADGDLSDPSMSRRFQDTSIRPRISGTLMGTELHFQRIDNPHSGCFFLSEAQMACWAAAPCFLDRSAEFWGPLESAATLGIMRTFALYKPSRENAAFLELQHLDNRYLGRCLQLEPDPPYRWAGRTR